MLIPLIFETIYCSIRRIQTDLHPNSEPYTVTNAFRGLRVFAKPRVYVNPRIFDVYILPNKVLLQKKANKKENVLLGDTFSKLKEDNFSPPGSFTFLTDPNTSCQRDLSEKRTKIFLGENQLPSIKERNSVYESERRPEYDYLRKRDKINISASDNIKMRCNGSNSSNSLRKRVHFEDEDTNSRPLSKKSAMESVSKLDPYIKVKRLKRLNMKHSDRKKSRDTKHNRKNEHDKPKNYHKNTPNNLHDQQISSFDPKTEANLNFISKERFINRMLRIIQTTNPVVAIEITEEIVEFIVKKFRNLKEAGLFLIFINYTTNGFDLFRKNTQPNSRKCLFYNLFDRSMFNEQDLDNAIIKFSSQYENFDTIEEGSRILEKLFFKVLLDLNVESFHYYKVDFRLYLRRNLRILFFEKYILKLK